MKKISLSLAMAFLMLASCKDDIQTEATIITSTSLADNQSGKTVNSFSVDLAASPIAIPASGDNVTWDYSNVTVKSQSSKTYLAPVANASFSSATYMSAEVDTFGRGTPAAKPAAANYYTELSATGMYSLGKTTPQVVLSYPSIGGTITYAAQNFVVTPKLQTLKFPVNYGDTVASANVIAKYNFVANAPAVGLNNVPGEDVVTTNYGYKVIGRGTIKIKNYADPMPVLLVRNWSSIKVNYFLGGAPASPALMAVVGLTDGTVSSTFSYDFYNTKLGLVASFSANANNTVITGAGFRRP